MSAQPQKTFEAQLTDDITELVYDPLGFVYYIYPWGEPGPLQGEEGPDEWQADVLKDLGDKLLTVEDAVQLATRSGHGIGKTCLIAWIIHWFISTRPHPQIVVTANTKEQLTSKTWRELAKWHKLALNKHWFEWTATKFYHVDHPETWFANAVPWSAEKSEAFAGTHEEHVLLLFDEASAIDDIIWEVSEGAMTTPGAAWVVFGNPTRNTGRFSECFKRFRHRWITREIDSRTAKKANSKQIEQWIEDYGEDSDFVRVRVLGQEPRAGSMQLIPGDCVDDALGKHLHPDVYRYAPKVLGVDIARFGDDQSVIVRRQGRAVFDLMKFRGKNTMEMASIIAQVIDEWEPDATFVDGVGIGAGVVDRLIQLHYTPIEVNAGSTPTNPAKYVNKRIEMWDEMRKWLAGEVAIPNDNELRDDLIGPEYGYSGAEKMQLEKKTDMKKRGLASPDCGDGLALTFSESVNPKADRFDLHLRRNIKRRVKSEYDPLRREAI